MRRIATILAWMCLCSAPAFGQGSQRQSVSVSPTGTPVPGADVWACQAGSTPNYSATPPCALANIYSDPSLGPTFLVAQPLVSDGLGNYTYYTVPGTYVEVITGPNVSGYSSTVVLACAPNSTASGCASGGGSPAGNDTQVQINNHSQFGVVAGLAVDSSTSPSAFNVPFSESTKGPRPRVDATAYGADPTGVGDSTTALTNAAAAACNAGSTLFIPPGTYSLTQPQSPSTSAVIPIPCARIHITALGDQGTAQFEQPPQAKLVVANLGSSPNAAPVFGFKYPTNAGDITIENLQISGYNQAISFYTITNIVLNNVCATAQSTSLTDNVPLKVTNVSWFRMTGGCLDSGSASLPMALFSGEAPLASEAAAVTYVQIEHVRGSGANFQYLQRVDTSGSGPGNFVFSDVTPLSSTADFLTVINTTGHMGQTALPQFGPIFFANVSLPHATGSGALLNFNSSGSNLTGLHIQNSSGSQQATPLVAVRMTAGSLQDCEVHGIVGALIEDGSGNPAGSCSLETRGGLDFLADSTIAPGTRLRSESTTGANPTPNLRFYLSPNSRASYGLDAGQGLLFNDGVNNGFNASLTEATSAAIDVQFANLLPPTNVSGSPTTGGTIPAGTYYPFVATTSNSCSTLSAPSIAGAPVTLSGSNTAITVTWTLPLQGVTPINGYCVAIASSATNANAGLSYAGAFVSGPTTASATLTAVSGSMQFPMGNAASSVHRFTPSGLNIGGGLNFYVDNGVANAYAITTAPAIATIPLGAQFSFQAAHANTGTSTLNVDGVGAINIKKNGGTGGSVGSNLAPGDIAAGQIVNVAYDGTNFQMQSTLGNASGGGGGGGANAALSNLSGVAINATLLPAAVNTVDAGSSALPMRNVYIGMVANQAAELDASLLTANRDVKIPDAAGTLMETTTNATCGQLPALTGNVTSSAGSCATTLAKMPDGNPVSIGGSVNGQIICLLSSTWQNCTPQQAEDAQTGTSYTIPNTDGGAVVAQSNSAAITDTVPDGTASGFGKGFFFVILNNNALGGSQITVNRQTSAQFAVNGRSALVNTFYLAPQQHAFLYCYDGTNWQVFFSGMGTYGVVFTQDYSGQSGSITSTTMITAPANGAYHFSTPITCDSATATTVQVSLSYTDTSSTAQTVNSSSISCSSLGSSSVGSFSTTIAAKASTTISFSTSASGATYDLHPLLEGAW